MSAGQDSNLHPLQSGYMPLPLDHLHSRSLLALTLIQELLCPIHDLDNLYMHTAMQLYLGGKCTFTSSRMMLMHIHLNGLPSSLNTHVLKLLI